MITNVIGNIGGDSICEWQQAWTVVVVVVTNESVTDVGNKRCG